MTHHHKLFTALVLQGALLAGCYEEENDNDEAATDSDASGEDTDASGEDTDASGEDTDTTGGDTDATGDCESTAECLNTTAWSECTADGVTCCWATGECCDYCCGHLDP